MTPVYRRCRDCGRDWNVSRLDPGGKIYICPPCERVRKLKERRETNEQAAYRTGRRVGAHP